MSTLQVIDLLLWAFWECMWVICAAWWLNDRLNELQRYAHEQMLKEGA